MKRKTSRRNCIGGTHAASVTFLSIAAWLGPMICAGGETATSETKVLVDFKTAKEEEQWTVVNDGVMGGLSQSGIEITHLAIAVFKGTLSLENNGGFASVRRLPHDYKLAGFDGILLRVKGDGRTYQFRVRTNERFDSISYGADFKATPGKWMTVKIPFKLLKPTYRGRTVPDAPDLRPEDIRQIGFLIGDKREGSFRLEIDWIQAYRQNSTFELTFSILPRLRVQAWWNSPFRSSLSCLRHNGIL